MEFLSKVGHYLFKDQVGRGYLTIVGGTIAGTIMHDGPLWYLIGYSIFGCTVYGAFLFISKCIQNKGYFSLTRARILLNVWKLTEWCSAKKNALLRKEVDEDSEDLGPVSNWFYVKTETALNKSRSLQKA